jgi:hypothetical protein
LFSKDLDLTNSLDKPSFASPKEESSNYTVEKREKDNNSNFTIEKQIEESP